MTNLAVSAPAPSAARHTARTHLIELVRAVTDRASRPGRREVLAKAIASGALTGQEGGQLVPTETLGVDDIVRGSTMTAEIRRLTGWLQDGYRPFRVKTGPFNSDQLASLRLLAPELSADPSLRCVPVWVVGHQLLSLDLPHARDLRKQPGTDPWDDARAVHAHCLTSLSAFIAADKRLRGVLAAADVVPRPFPIEQRYQRALAGLATLIGPVDLPTEFPSVAACGPATLFSDPKPGNFITTASHRRDLGQATAQVWRVDLDLIHYLCPVSLQIVVALFAHPIAFRIPGHGSAQLADLRAFAHSVAPTFGVSPPDLDAMLLYHLLRNFVSAAVPFRSDGQAKATALALVLADAIDQLDLTVRARLTAGQLRRWHRLHGC